MNLESRTVQTQKTPQELFEFLTQVENYKQLMPEDTKFETHGDDKFCLALKACPKSN